MTFNDRVRSRRKELGLSQQELAKLTGIGQSSIGQIENGRNKSTTKILELAKALQTTPEYLMHGIKIQKNNVLNESKNTNYGNQNISGGDQTNIEGDSYTLYQDNGEEPTKAQINEAESQFLKSMPVMDINIAARYLIGGKKDREQIYDTSERTETFIPKTSETIGVTIADDSLIEFSADRIRASDILLVEPQMPPRNNDLIFLCLNNTGYWRGLICRLKIEIDGSRQIRHNGDSFIPMPEGAVIGGVIVELKRRFIPTGLLKSRLDTEYDIMQSKEPATPIKNDE